MSSSKPLSPGSSRRRALSPKKLVKNTEEPAVDEKASPASGSSSIFSTSAPEFLKPYLATNAMKRDGEWFFIWYSAAWIGFFAIVLIFRLWEGISDLGYNTIGLIACVPCIAIPLIWPSSEEAKVEWYKRYTFKANVWVAAFNFIGNYFWTHYFFALLGASYTFPIKYTLNKIPPVCFLLTQPYFQTYHAFSNLLLRFVRRKMRPTWLRFFVVCLTVLAVALFWSLAETVTISSFPYYSFTDRTRMYQIGTGFYALYFIVSFPMFIRIDEDGSTKWTWNKALIDSLAAAMIVFTLCDFWRLTVGNIVPGMNTDTLPFL